MGPAAAVRIAAAAAVLLELVTFRRHITREREHRQEQEELQTPTLYTMPTKIAWLHRPLAVVQVATLLQ